MVQQETSEYCRKEQSLWGVDFGLESIYTDRAFLRDACEERTCAVVRRKPHSFLWKRGVDGLRKRLCALLIFVLVLSSCGVLAEEYPRTLTDQAGREVVLEAEPQRVVSGYYISTSACIALGLKDRLVAIETGAQKRNIYALAAPELTELPNVGSAKAFDLEACVAAEPDLVILPKKLADQAETLEKLGIHVILVYPESHEQLSDMLMLLGQALNAEEAAAALVDKYGEVLNQAEMLAAGADRPTALMLGNSSYLTCAPGGMYQSTLIAAAGGENAAESLEGTTWTEVSYEQLLALNPDFLLIPSEAAYTAEDLLGDAQLAALDAVQNRRVYAMPSEYEAWDSPTPSGILGVLWTLHVLHGDLYSEEALKQQVSDFYQTFYGFAPEDAADHS